MRARGIFRGQAFLLLVAVAAMGTASEESHAVASIHGHLPAPATVKSPDPDGIQDPIASVGPLDDLRAALYHKAKPRHALVQLRKASDLLRDGKLEKARRAVASVKSDPDYGDHARWITAEAAILEAQDDFTAKHYEKAKQEARDAVTALLPIPENFPYSPLNRWLARATGRANLILGRVACQAKKWTDCRKQYENGLERLAIADALVYVRPEDVDAYAAVCSRQGSEPCRAWLQRLAAVHPHNTLEYKTLARALPDFVETLPHGSFYGRITIPYRGADTDSTAFDDAMGKYLDHKDKDAIQAFRQFLDEFPRSSSRFRAKYWLAQAMLHEKKDDDAKKLLLELQQSSPLSYYGLLASIAAGTDLEATIRTTSPVAQDYDPMLHPADLIRLRRAQALLSAKAYDPAALELRDMKPREGVSNPFLLYLAMLQSEAGAHSSAFPVLNELVARGDTSLYTQSGLKLVFPVENLDEIKKSAVELGLDPILVLSLMKQESAFDPGAMSNTGALGLMQLMPATASDIVSDLARAELVSPEANIRTGMKYLSQLMRRYNGNIVFALAAYNAGPGSVNRWIKAQPQRHDMLEFIESIPFKETREYVSSIIRNYFWYSRRLETESSKNLTLAHFWGEEMPKDLSGVALAAEKPSPLPLLSPSPEPSSSPSSSPSPSPSPAADPAGETFGPPLPSATPSPAEDPEYGPAVQPSMKPEESPRPQVSMSPKP